MNPSGREAEYSSASCEEQKRRVKAPADSEGRLMPDRNSPTESHIVALWEVSVNP